MGQFGSHVEEDLEVLDAKLKQLRNEYEQYFLGGRKREPHLLRTEVTKMVAYYANVPIQNTGYRFRFNNLRARFFSLRRHWDATLRKIEDGRYERHLFKAALHQRGRGEEPAGDDAGTPPGRDAGASPDLFEAYVAARRACGQDERGITRDKLAGLLARQEAAIRQKTGCQEVRFRVVVEDGKPKLKATPVR
jgi:hypothetical protein